MSEHVIVENAKSKAKTLWNKAKKPVLITAGAVATIGVATAVVKARSKALDQEVFEEDTVPFETTPGGYTVTEN